MKKPSLRDLHKVFWQNTKDKVWEILMDEEDEYGEFFFAGLMCLPTIYFAYHCCVG